MSKYPNLPEATKATIDNYVDNRWEPGRFVTAVMANNLIEAFSWADENNTICMRDIVSYVYNEVPMGCRGSYEKVEAWLKEKPISSKGGEYRDQ